MKKGILVNQERSLSAPPTPSEEEFMGRNNPQDAGTLDIDPDEVADDHFGSSDMSYLLH